MLDGFRGPFKVQLCGPWTLAATLELPRTLNVAIADPGAVADLTASLAEGAVEADLLRERLAVGGASVSVIPSGRGRDSGPGQIGATRIDRRAMPNDPFAAIFHASFRLMWKQEFAQCDDDRRHGEHDTCGHDANVDCSQPSSKEAKGFRAGPGNCPQGRHAGDVRDRLFWMPRQSGLGGGPGEQCGSARPGKAKWELGSRCERILSLQLVFPAPGNRVRDPHAEDC